jgi:hypothetical protein
MLRITTITLIRIKVYALLKPKLPPKYFKETGCIPLLVLHVNLFNLSRRYTLNLFIFAHFI